VVTDPLRTKGECGGQGRLVTLARHAHATRIRHATRRETRFHDQRDCDDHCMELDPADQEETRSRILA